MSKVEKIKIRENKRHGKVLALLACFALLSIFSLSFSMLAASSDNDQILSQLEQTLSDSSYSEFQKRMVLNTAQDAIDKGISAEDTLSIVKGSINNEIDAYNIKKFLDTAITARDDGISETPLLNKVKEGLAKKVDEQLIVKVLSQKSENMKIAQDLLLANKIPNGEPEEMIDILADSLANGVPKSALENILKRSSADGKSWLEVEEVTQELGNIGLKAAELGINSDNLEMIFTQALESNNTTMENICSNIQDLIVAAIAAKVTSGTVSKDGTTEGAGTVISDLPSSPSGSGITGSVPTPSGETGSSPISSGGENKTDNESGSSPLD